ncbi:MAG: response regulator [Candidatus Binatia bacterium]
MLTATAPLAPASSPHRESPRDRRAPGPPTMALVANRPRVLVVEDDDRLRALLAAALRRTGHAVTELADGASAVDHLMPWLTGLRASPPPDAIVSDIRMPGWSGLELLTAVRDAGLRTPVILVTAFGAAETHAAAHRLGATAVVDKPFAIDALCQLVRDVLDRK